MLVGYRVSTGEAEAYDFVWFITYLAQVRRFCLQNSYYV